MTVNISKRKYENWRDVRNIKWTENSIFANFWSQIFIFQIEKNSKNFPNFTILKIIKFPLSINAQNNKISEIVQCRKITNFQNLKTCKILKFQKFRIHGELLYMYFECSNNLNKRKKTNSKLEKSNNSTFVISISKFRSFYI